MKLRQPRPLLADGTVDIDRWIKRVADNRSQEQIQLIRKACEFAKEYLDRGLEMAEILHDLGLDAATVAAAIAYNHAYNNNSPTREKPILNDIERSLGQEVVSLVAGLQKLHSLPTQKITQSENLRRMLLAVVEDVRVVLIRLAEHTCEMHALVNGHEKFRRQLAQESLDIYAPLANRLGIGQLKWELEDLAFRFLEPITYKHIAKLLDERRTDREDYINRVILQVEKALQPQGIEPEISGRAKHIYSIWKKMQRKGVGYNEIYDVRGIRILVSNIHECYATLGAIHSIWQPIPKEFDDYIANPKDNGYRSLHTAVVGPEGRALEVQVRTHEMHAQAELGVASHWRYKEGGSPDLGYEAKLANLRQILKWQEAFATEKGDKESDAMLHAEVFRDRVYVLTPKGKVIDLPEGATALDFAYHVHTEIGNRCRGVKINGKIVPLTKPLKSGDQIEVLTAKAGGPSRDWLNPQLGYLKTARARAKAHQWFKRQDKDQNISEGRDALDRELKRLGVRNLNFEALAHQLKFPKVDDMLSALGGGDIRVAQILHAVQVLAPPILKKIPPVKAAAKEKKASEVDIRVAGVGNLLCQMARCCKPVPGDEIIGYITVGRGVSVHRKECANVLEAGERNQNRLIEVEWGGKGKLQNQYTVEVAIHAFDRQGLLRDISFVLANEHVNVVAVNTITSKKENTADFRLKIEVSGIEILGKIFSKIQQLPNIIEIKRVD